jgi:SWI/SNF-related matrix-associated actin-dependent regulator 1 of chromatin subfamily A
MMVIARHHNRPGPRPTPLGVALLAHQQEGVDFAISRLRISRGIIIGDVMGLGKTIEAIVTANVIGPRRILVVCPATVLLTWRREIWKWQTLDLPVFLIQAGHDTAVNQMLLKGTVDGWCIINYDILTKFPEVKTGNWDLLIIDESHKLKNPEAIRTQQLLGSDSIPPVEAEKVLLLTGTPIVNYVHDVWTQLHFLDSAKWPSLSGFVAEYYFPGYRIISPSQVVGDVRDLQGLRRELATVMIRRPKAVLNLPPKHREIIGVDVKDNEFWLMLAEQRKLLTQLQCRLMKLLNEVVQGETSDEVRCLQDKINRVTAVIRYQVGINKVPAVIGYLRTCVGKTLVFAYHHDVIMALVAALADQGVAWFTGRTSLKNRDRAANRFQHDPNCHFFIGNIEAAGQGITLTAARHVVFAEPDWRGTFLEQAEDRAHRIGQCAPVLVTYLLLRPSAWSTDSWMATKAAEKRVVIDTVLGTPVEQNIARTLISIGPASSA